MDPAAPYALPLPFPALVWQGASPPRRQSRAVAPRAALVARMRAASRNGDADSEREASTALARVCLNRTIHFAEAIAILLRSIELSTNSDDRALRLEAAAHLASLGRHDEAAEVLRSGTAGNEAETVELGLAAGDAAARMGDAGGAAVIYRELAIANLRDARPLERLATISIWNSAALNEERSSDAWLEAAARRGTGDDALLNFARAFEVAPHNPRAAEAFATATASQGRHDAADEILREHGIASGSVLASARERLERAREHGLPLTAFGAALDAAVHGMPASESLATLEALLKETERSLNRGAVGDESRVAASALLEALQADTSATRAEGLARVAARLSDGAKGMVLAAASEGYFDADDKARALTLARQACALARDSARPRSALLRLGLEDEATLRELEQAMAGVAARASTYRMLGRKAGRLGRHDLAIVFLRRALVLRPGDPELRQRLLANQTAALGAFSDEAYGANLVALATEPYPLLEVEPWIAKAIAACGPRASKRAAHAVRSILQVVGPVDSLVEPTMGVAVASGESRCALEVAVLHAVAGGTEEPDRWLRAVDLALPLDTEAAAAHLSQAAAHRADPTESMRRLEAVERNLDALDEGARADAIIDLATARAWLSEHHESAEVASQRWRELAALRWDLAGDIAGAEEALFYACARTPTKSVTPYCAELLVRGGVDLALERIRQRVAVLDEGVDSRIAGELLAAAASIALENDRPALAIELGLEALTRRPPPCSAVAALDAVAARLATKGGTEEAISLVERVYETLADLAAGSRGAHAAFHRSSRILESMGARQQALTFALRALQASNARGPALERVRRLVELGENSAHRLELLEGTFDTLRRDPRPSARQVAVDALREATLLALGMDPSIPSLTRDETTPVSSRDVPIPSTLSSNAVHAAHAMPTLETEPPPGVREAARWSIPCEPTAAEASDFPSMLRTPKRPDSAVLERPPSEPTEWSLWERGEDLALTESESALERNEAFDELAQRLGERLDPEDRPTHALLRIRRASIYEAKLHDRNAARTELEALLAESERSDLDALRHLARLHGVDGQTLEAARCWEQLAHRASRDAEIAQAAVRACEAFLDAGEPNRADAVLQAVHEVTGTADLVLMRLAVASALAGDDDEELPDFELDPIEPLSAEPRTYDIVRHTSFGDIPNLRRSLLASAPAPDSVDADELELLREELDHGEYEAGEQLAAIFESLPGRFTEDLIDVRRTQARLRPGNIATLHKLVDAVREGGRLHHAHAVEHVLCVFQGVAAPVAPRLEELQARSEATMRLLFGHLEGTVGDVLSTLSRAGLYRTENARTALDGCDLVTPGSPTTLGRIHGALQRLWHLDGVRLYHRHVRGPLGYRVELLSPVSAVVHGTADEPTPPLAFIVGSALAAATPPCAYAEALGEAQLETLLRGLLAAFGPVDNDATAVKTVEVAQLAQDLWGIVRGADERNFRELCYEPNRLTPEVAQLNAGRARRRAGLYACGNLLTALVQTAAELGLSTRVPFHDPDALRELAANSSINDLVDMALDEEYAASRWRRGTVPPPGAPGSTRASTRPGAP